MTALRLAADTVDCHCESCTHVCYKRGVADLGEERPPRRNLASVALCSVPQSRRLNRHRVGGSKQVESMRFSLLARAYRKLLQDLLAHGFLTEMTAGRAATGRPIP
jgi:hypothetical protein